MCGININGMQESFGQLATCEFLKNIELLGFEKRVMYMRLEKRNKEKVMEIDMISLGKRIRSIRKKKKWTIEKLSEKSKISSVYISQIETGTRIGSLETLIALSNALEVSIEDILIDSLLFTNAEKKTKHEDDLSYIFLDCTENESRFLIKNAENVKELLKRFQKK